MVLKSLLKTAVSSTFPGSSSPAKPFELFLLGFISVCLNNMCVLQFLDFSKVDVHMHHNCIVSYRIGVYTLTLTLPLLPQPTDFFLQQSLVKLIFRVCIIMAKMYRLFFLIPSINHCLI